MQQTTLLTFNGAQIGMRIPRTDFDTLHVQIRNMHPSVCEITSNYEFVSAFNKRLPMLNTDHVHFDDGLVIAGGCISSIIHDRTIRDVDVFLYGFDSLASAEARIEQCINEIIIHAGKLVSGAYIDDATKINCEYDRGIVGEFFAFASSYHERLTNITSDWYSLCGTCGSHSTCTDCSEIMYNLCRIGHVFQPFMKTQAVVRRTPNTITVNVGHVVVQFVLKIYEQREQLLDSFDIDACRALFNGQCVLFDPRCALALRSSSFPINRHCTAREYTKRVHKYMNRGFTISVPGVSASAITNYNGRCGQSISTDKLVSNARGASLGSAYIPHAYHSEFQINGNEPYDDDSNDDDDDPRRIADISIDFSVDELEITTHEDEYTLVDGPLWSMPDIGARVVIDVNSDMRFTFRALQESIHTREHASFVLSEKLASIETFKNAVQSMKPSDCDFWYIVQEPYASQLLAIAMKLDHASKTKLHGDRQSQIAALDEIYELGQAYKQVQTACIDDMSYKIHNELRDLPKQCSTCDSWFSADANKFVLHPATPSHCECGSFSFVFAPASETKTHRLDITVFDEGDCDDPMFKEIVIDDLFTIMRIDSLRITIHAFYSILSLRLSGIASLTHATIIVESAVRSHIVVGDCPSLKSLHVDNNTLALYGSLPLLTRCDTSDSCIVNDQTTTASMRRIYTSDLMQRIFDDACMLSFHEEWLDATILNTAFDSKLLNAELRTTLSRVMVNGHTSHTTLVAYKRFLLLARNFKQVAKLNQRIIVRTMLLFVDDCT